SRFIEEPERPFHSNEACNGQPPPLACREIGCGQGGDAGEAGGRKRWRHGGLAAQELHPEGEIFAHCERRFQGVLMAEVVRLFGEGEAGTAATKGERAAGWPHQPGDKAKQRGLARPIGAGDDEGLARAEPEAHARKHLPAAPAAREIGRFKPHQIPSPPPAGPVPTCPAQGARATRRGPSEARHFLSMLLMGVDCLEPRKKRPYKPLRNRVNPPTTARRLRPATLGEPGNILPLRRAPPVGWDRT